MTEQVFTQQDGKFSGVFSIQKTMKIGAGTTARRVQQQAFYWVEEGEDGRLYMQPMGPDMAPFGPRSVVGRDDLLKNYLPEPMVYQQQVLPMMREVQKAIARGDKFRARGESFTAEFEYSKALKLDAGNVRANFGIGICYLARGDKDKAREVFERVIKLDTAFENENKHLFNEFGINLRKAGMFSESLAYYEKGIEHDQADEHLQYNAARAAYELKDFDRAAGHLQAALKIRPDFQEAVQFLDFLKKKNLIPS